MFTVSTVRIIIDVLILPTYSAVLIRTIIIKWNRIK